MSMNRDMANYEYTYNLGKTRGTVVAFEIPAVENRKLLLSKPWNLCWKSHTNIFIQHFWLPLTSTSAKKL